MKKIPTMFERDWLGNKSRVIDKIHPGCEWVAAGEGVATRKIDGTSCLIRDGRLYKRRELNNAFTKVPDGFELSDEDHETGRRIGWVPVVAGAPEDRWHMEAFCVGPEQITACDDRWSDGTYELVGPKIQGNPEHYAFHTLVPHHSTDHYDNVPRTFYGLREWLHTRDIEGLVFHHPDGRMAKIKLRDFGINRKLV